MRPIFSGLENNFIKLSLVKGATFGADEEFTVAGLDCAAGYIHSGITNSISNIFQGEAVLAKYLLTYLNTNLIIAKAA